MASFYIDIDLDEIYDELSKSEKEELVKWLENDGYFTKEELKNTPSLIENEFEEIINKLIKNRLLLTNEEDELLRKITKRF